jgi:glycosyltransferase involved in cell wall biosynthesis
MKKINTLHIVPSVSLPADGVARFVLTLCEGLYKRNKKTCVAALDWTPMLNPPRYLKRFSLGIGPQSLGRSPMMFNWLSNEVDSGDFDVIHNHGSWMMPSIYSAIFSKKKRCKLMASTHGSLSPWTLKHNFIKKKLFWIFFQRAALCKADCFHATSYEEYKNIRSLGFKQPVSIIPIGVEIDQTPLLIPSSQRKQLLYLARIHPGKGVDVLLNAWSYIEKDFPEWDLIIAGPGSEEYLMQIQHLQERLCVERVFFKGLLTGLEKLIAYRNASLYVLPTHSENFGITIAEALASATPVIVTHGAPWAELESREAGWWIERGVEPLVECLKLALSLPSDELNEMGRKGREWMLADFSWDDVIMKFSKTYYWMTFGGPIPAWIMTD